MNIKIVFCGVGGQGIILLTRLLGEVLTRSGLRVISTESHGMATRGGSVTAFMKVGNFNSPLIKASDADVVVVLHTDELERGLFFARENALLILNGVKGQNLNIKAIDISNLMKRLKLNGRLANMVCAGILLYMFNIEMDEAIKTLEEMGKANAQNIKALKVGYMEGIHVPATA